MSGLCECGCGRRTRVAHKTDRSKDWVKGRPLRFVVGHAMRGRPGPGEVLDVGARFGRLVVLRFEGAPNGHRVYAVACDCGAEATTRGDAMVTGATLSCGCRPTGMPRRHGHAADYAHSPTYSSWLHMIQRCTNPKVSNWKNYGGRGITVCDRWRDSFEAFLADMGERPEGTTIDRTDVDGNYEPGNCRWATRVEQANNRRPLARRH